QSVRRPCENATPPLVKIRRGCTRVIGHAAQGAWASGNVDAGIVFLRDPHVKCVRSQVGCSDEPVRTNLPFDADVPLVDICRFGIVVQIAKEGVGNVQTALAQTSRERISAWIACVGIIEATGRIVERDTAGPGRRQRHADDDRIAWNEVERSAVSRAHCRTSIACDIPTEAKTRSKISPLDVLSSLTRKAGIAWIKQAGRRVLIVRL